MGIFDFLFGNRRVERAAAQKLPAELATELEEAGAALEERLTTVEDNEQNRQQLSHIIGIERWGQRRLRVALGDPYVEEEYDAYLPAPELSMNQLRQQFQETRADTVALARKVAESQQWAVGAIRHNSLGDLSVRGWMQYLLSHAERESKQFR